MNRKELYEKVKKYNLQEKIKETYGDNYTRVSNGFLFKEVNRAEMAEQEATKQYTVKPVKVIKKKRSMEERLENLVKFLTLKHLLLKSEADSILN